MALLNDDDLLWLTRQISATAEVLGYEIKPNAAMLMAEDLAAAHERPVLDAALRRIRAEHAGRLTLKAILDRIDELSGRPAANEAWALAAQALDERATIVWTSEMSDAWAVARPLAAGGDLVGGRMAFIAAYERLVRAARDERRMPQVVVSLGWDTEGRAVALERAMALGYLTAEQGRALLPAATATPGFDPAGLLTGSIEPAQGASPETRHRLAKLRADLAASGEKRHADRLADKQRQAQDLAIRKAQAQRLVDEHIAAEAAQEGGQP